MSRRHEGLNSLLTLVADCFSIPSSQVDQLRSELMQERSERHDLEMDKSALERQVRSAPLRDGQQLL